MFFEKGWQKVIKNGKRWAKLNNLRITEVSEIGQKFDGSSESLPFL